MHVQESVFPGGCFFASVAAEIDTQPGPVRDSAMAASAQWFEHLASAIQSAQAEGEIDPAEDAVQLAFEVNAYLLMANAQFVAGDAGALDRARRALKRKLESVARS